MIFFKWNLFQVSIISFLNWEVFKIENSVLLWRFKAHLFWEGQRSLKKCSPKFWIYQLISKLSGRLLQILWPSHNRWTSNLYPCNIKKKYRFWYYSISDFIPPNLKPHNLYYFSASKKTGLQPGVRYKFRISAESSQGSVGESSIVVQTFNELEIGDIGLEVSNGTVVIT